MSTSAHRPARKHHRRLRSVGREHSKSSATRDPSEFRYRWTATAGWATDGHEESSFASRQWVWELPRTSETRRWWKSRQERVLRPWKRISIKKNSNNFRFNSPEPTQASLQWFSSCDCRHKLCIYTRPAMHRSCWDCESRSCCVASCCASIYCPFVAFVVASLAERAASPWPVDHLTKRESCKSLPAMLHGSARHSAWWCLRSVALHSWCFPRLDRWSGRVALWLRDSLECGKHQIRHCSGESSETCNWKAARLLHKTEAINWLHLLRKENLAQIEKIDQISNRFFHRWLKKSFLVFIQIKH